MLVLHVIKVVRIVGAEQHLLTLAHGLRAQNVDARIVLLVEPDTPMSDYVRAARQQGIPIQRLTIRGDADVTLYARLQKLFRSLKPDIVHTHLLHADLFAIPSAKMAGVPVIVTSRHNDNLFRRKPAMRMLNLGLWRMVDAGIGISQAITHFCIQIEGALPQRMHTIYYGLEGDEKDRNEAHKALVGELHLDDKAVFVGIVCRLIEQKGIPYGLRAFAKIAAKYPDAHLVIAGDGALRAELEAEAAQLGLKGRAFFLGWRGDIPAVMASLDVLLMPSLWEGFGLVMLEAMAQSVPVIGSAVSAIPEVVIDGETGRLVPPRDVDAMAQALDEMLGDTALRRHMGLVGQDWVETRFSAERMVEETLELYRQLLSGRTES